MQKKVEQLLILFVLVLALGACSKGGGTTDDTGGGPHVVNPTDTNAPDIIINTPLANQVFTSGATINISGRVTDDFGLYRGTIRVINDANGLDVKNQPYEIHGIRSYDFNLTVITGVAAPTDYTIVVYFEDHGLNSTTKSVKVKVNP